MVDRVGFGFDVHRLAVGRPLVLGGVTIPWDRGLEGHSDADVLTHAVIDALLGAAGLGDIGQHFPDTDARWAGADSIEMLQQVVLRVRQAGYGPVQVDATVVAEAPRLTSWREEMASRLAGILGLAPGNVNIKFTTTEGLGFTGEGRGIAACAVAALKTELGSDR